MLPSIALWLSFWAFPGLFCLLWAVIAFDRPGGCMGLFARCVRSDFHHITAVVMLSRFRLDVVAVCGFVFALYALF